MVDIQVIASTNENTVVSEYETIRTTENSYESESTLEQKFIKLLQSQSYEYLPIHKEKDLIENLRKQLSTLNNYEFTDKEWNDFFKNEIANVKESIEEKTRKIQIDYIEVIDCEDGNKRNIKLIDKNNIHNNKLQIINQYTSTGNYDNRYDVTILVNGLPLVHVELKRRGVSIKQAFNEIERYQRDSFWSGCGLYEYVQIFVISNGTETKYYSNTTRNAKIKENKKLNSSKKKTSNSFEFTSYWADANNKCIYDLMDFTKTFFSKHTLLNVLTKYCVFTSENLLLVMRPYQIVATERIINKIEIANNYKYYGSKKAGGYIWHTTGSGKTLTSFKTAQLVSNREDVEKVLFVVDRKDLDYQTMKEYDKFEKGCANGNKSTAILARQLANKDKNGNYHEYKIIVTTIQKLSNFVKANKEHEIYDKKVVFIFDECHRSQFGQFHSLIIKAFKKYFLFGFTGTPIFAINAKLKIENVNLATTEQVFGEKLHTYTIVDAIRDGNVLPFRIDYVNTIKEKNNIKDKKIVAIDEEKILLKPERISQVTKYILEHFDQKTKRYSANYIFNKTINIEKLATDKKDSIKVENMKCHINGFNSIFAVSSIKFAKAYYEEFQKQMKDWPESKKLKIATIFSYGVNESDDEFLLDDENSDDTSMLDAPSRDFLESAIDDYNKIFKTSYDTSSDKFGNYYKDVSLRMKNREIDILIVVNMFLTGFDATTLNTLWVDKNLKYHGLIQAFSRTNRILNSVKTYGNIVCFRDLQEKTEEAIGLFGDKDAKGVVLMKTFESYYNGYDENGKHYDGYCEVIEKLLNKYPVGMMPLGEKSEKEFISLFSYLLKLLNILSSFDEFEGKTLISDYDMQDYMSLYQNLHDKYRPENKENKEDVSDDLEFEMELIKSMDINIDYILLLIEKYHETNCLDGSIVASIHKALDSSYELRSKKLLIEAFINSINVNTNVSDEWAIFVNKQYTNDLLKIINEENLKETNTIEFMNNCFENGELKIIGTDIDKILPPISYFAPVNRVDVKNRVIEKLQLFFDKYNGLI